MKILLVYLFKICGPNYVIVVLNSSEWHDWLRRAQSLTIVISFYTNNFNSINLRPTCVRVNYILCWPRDKNSLPLTRTFQLRHCVSFSSFSESKRTSGRIRKKKITYIFIRSIDRNYKYFCLLNQRHLRSYTRVQDYVRTLAFRIIWLSFNVL